MHQEEDYKPVFNHEHRRIFAAYINALNIADIDYFAIGFQDTIFRKSFSLMSNLEWQKFFKAQGYAAYDPIRKAAFGCNRNFFSFDHIDYGDNLGKEIMRQRKLHHIVKGLVMMERHLGHNYMLTLATSYSKFNAFEFYMKHCKNLLVLFHDLKKIIEPEVQHYIAV